VAATLLIAKRFGTAAEMPANVVPEAA
jgi:hypothetical protein